MDNYKLQRNKTFNLLKRSLWVAQDEKIKIRKHKRNGF